MERSILYYQNDAYKKVGEINNDSSFQEFVNRQLKVRALPINVYLIFLLVLVWVLVSIFISRFSIITSFSDFFLQFGFGVFFGLLLIPFHELLHALYLFGIGTSVKFKLDFRRFRFDCFADQFVLSKEEYHLFLILPFVIITSMLLVLIYGFSHFSVLFLSVIIMHTSICAADFSLLNYSHLLSKHSLFVYYDNNLKKTIFLEEQIK